MDDLLKKLIYSGVGLVSMSVEKLQKSLDKLVDEDKISHEEGKKIVDEFLENTSSRRNEFEGKVGNIAEDLLKRMNLATSNRIAELEKRVAELESKHAGDAPSEEKKTAKKAATAAK